MSIGTPQNYLLTLNMKKEGEIKNALPGVHIAPFYLNSETGVWVIYARFEPNTQLPEHFHTGIVHFYTTAGSWMYLEYPDDVQTAGSYLFEPAGSTHTLRSDEGAEGFIMVEGANVNFNEDGSLMFIMDAGWIEPMLHTVAKETGQKMPRYIKPNANNDFSDKATNNPTV